MSDQQRIETAAGNCEVLRARLARYEDADGKPITTIAEQAREIERLNSDYNEACEDAMCVARELERQKMNCLNLLQQLEDLKAQHEQDAQTIKVLQAMARQLKSQPSGVVQWTDADEIMQMAFEEGQPGDDASGYYFELEEFDLFLQRLMEEVARLNSSPASAGDERALYEQSCKERAASNGRGYEAHYFKRQAGVGEYLNPGAEHGWQVWQQARADLSANHSEQVREWGLAADELPSCGKPVLAYYLNSHGMGRRIRAMHVKRFTVEAEEFADPETQCCEYSEQDDCYYTTEGWYELIDNWPDYSSCAVIEGVITHWMPLPAAPSAGSQGGDV